MKDAWALRHHAGAGMSPRPRVCLTLCVLRPDMENGCSLAAKRAGIGMPETVCFPGRDGAAGRGVRRFDQDDGGRVHVHIASGLLHLPHRYAFPDDENLFRLGTIPTRGPGDVEKLIRLMAFNVRIGNRDDHFRNFFFPLDAKGRQRLAPACDRTPSQGLEESTPAWSTAGDGTSRTGT